MRAPSLQTLVSSFLLAGAALAQDGIRIAWGSETLAAEARAIRPGERLVVDGLRSDGQGAELILELERVEAFTSGARIVVNGDGGASELEPPGDVRFRGRVIGEIGSAAVLSVLEDGTVRGVVSRADGYWILGGGGRGAARDALLRKAAAQPAEGAFRCESDGAVAPPDERTPAGSAMRGKATTTQHTAVVAIETDHELYLRLGSVDALVSYVGDLVAFASGIYDDELDTSLVIGDLSVWTTSNDPWREDSSWCALLELGNYWYENRSGIERTITHFLSGKGGGSGIAWLGVLCRGNFLVDQGQSPSCPKLPRIAPMGGAYGFTQGIQGSFDPAIQNVVWDIVAFAHEVGHNFDSPHTHCYEGLGGMSSAVDECYEQVQIPPDPACFDGQTSLPAGCPGPGQHCGTLMSYCHLRAGGMANLALSFGRDFPYGVLPDRVPDRMRAHVEANAACMPRIDPEAIFADGFESGSTGRWSPF